MLALSIARRRRKSCITIVMYFINFPMAPVVRPTALFLNMARIISPSQAVRPKVTPRLVIVMDSIKEQRCADNSEKGHEVDVCSLAAAGTHQLAISELRRCVGASYSVRVRWEDTPVYISNGVSSDKSVKCPCTFLPCLRA